MYFIKKTFNYLFFFLDKIKCKLNKNKEIEISFLVENESDNEINGFNFFGAFESLAHSKFNNGNLTYEGLSISSLQSNMTYQQFLDIATAYPFKINKTEFSFIKGNKLQMKSLIKLREEDLLGNFSIRVMNLQQKRINFYCDDYYDFYCNSNYQIDGRTKLQIFKIYPKTSFVIKFISLQKNSK